MEWGTVRCGEIRLRLFLRQRLFDGLGQLVGARGAFEAAADTFELGDDILGLHAIHQSGHALRVAIAAAVELHVLQDAVLDFKLDGLTACALGTIGVSHWIFYWLSAFSIQQSAFTVHYQADS